MGAAFHPHSERRRYQTEDVDVDDLEDPSPLEAAPSSSNSPKVQGKRQGTSTGKDRYPQGHRAENNKLMHDREGLAA